MSKKIVAELNQVLLHELTSINQFFLHARMCADWGFEALNQAAYKKSIDDMKQADALIARILFLNGLPNLQQLGRLQIGEHALESIQCDSQFLQTELPILRQAIQSCEAEQDYVSRDLLEGILAAEEEYVDWLNTQLQLAESAGKNNYLQSQI